MIEPRPIPGHPGMFEQPHEVVMSEEKNPSLYCFLEMNRVCGPDCMAFNTMPPREPDYAEQPFSNCHVLVNLHRGGKHLVILAGMLAKRTTASPPMPSPPVPR